MIITIYDKNNEKYECELWQNEFGEYIIMNKSDNIDELSYGMEQGEQGFTDSIQIELK